MLSVKGLSREHRPFVEVATEDTGGDSDGGSVNTATADSRQAARESEVSELSEGSFDSGQVANTVTAQP